MYGITKPVLLEAHAIGHFRAPVAARIDLTASFIARLMTLQSLIKAHDLTEVRVPQEPVAWFPLNVEDDIGLQCPEMVVTKESIWLRDVPSNGNTAVETLAVSIDELRTCWQSAEDSRPFLYGQFAPAVVVASNTLPLTPEECLVAVNSVSSPETDMAQHDAFELPAAPVLDSRTLSNKNAIMSALKAVAVEQVVVEYHGYGDSGAVVDTTTTPPTALDSFKVEQKYHVYVNAQASREEVRQVSFSEAIEDLCEALISLTGHDGYENNEGGGGTLTLDVEQGRYVLEHYDVYEERNTSTYAG